MKIFKNTATRKKEREQLEDPECVTRHGAIEQGVEGELWLQRSQEVPAQTRPQDNGHNVISQDYSDKENSPYAANTRSQVNVQTLCRIWSSSRSWDRNAGYQSSWPKGEGTNHTIYATVDNGHCRFSKGGYSMKGIIKKVPSSVPLWPIWRCLWWKYRWVNRIQTLNI